MSQSFVVLRQSSDLLHFGILGMKWGIRRYQNPDGTLTTAGKKRYSKMDTLTTKSGEPLTLAQHRSKTKDADFTIYAQGKKVGNLFLEDHGDTLYVNWIDIKSKERGKGYASSVMDYVVKYGESNGYKYATLEVPGTSPDARHIYEKVGFEEDGMETQDDIWGGLTRMRKRF